MTPEPPIEQTAAPYQVLARKYRPSVFAELIGQDALVRTLSNAIESGRIAHAYMLTGVRGVGKTTTARILARALNCIGPDGAGGPTTAPCGVCEHCRAIAEDRHVDVIEMDAASHTGIDNMRELIDGVRYRPVSARYKIYIIDEVHMLSKAAFNALLKTLEEPPPHVRFVFATTEIRKVPITVVSRCQRFDLRRLDADELIGHLERVAAKEGATIDAGALALIARAADGSVRDALSILDQAIVHCPGGIDEARVRDMLGLADRVRIFDLFEAVMTGDIKTALDEIGREYAAGADPLTVLQDLLDLTHWLTRLRLLPEAARDPALPEAERKRGSELAARLSIPALARAWQMLLKGLGEARLAPDALAAAEMVLVRLAHVADLPSPAEAVAALSKGAKTPAAAPPTAPPPEGAPPPPSLPSRRPAPGGGVGGDGGGPRAALAPVPDMPPEPEAAPATSSVAPLAEIAPPDAPTSFDDVVALAAQRREMVLHAYLRNTVHLVAFEPGRIALRLAEDAPARLANDLANKLNAWTGRRWVVVVSSDAEHGAPTLRERDEAARAARIAEARGHPVVQAVIDAFPGAEITDVRLRSDAPEPSPENQEETP